MRTLKNLLNMLKYVKKYTSHFLGFTIIDGLLWGAIHCYCNVLFLKILFDFLQKGKTLNDIILLVFYSTIFLVITYTYHEWYVHRKRQNSIQDLHKHMQIQLFKKAKSIDLFCYDNPDFYTDYVWAVNESDKRALSICDDIGKLISRLFSSIVIVLMLVDVDRYILVFVLVFLVFSLMLKYLKTNISFKKTNEIMPKQRYVDYIGRVFYLQDYAKEIRTSSVKGILFKKFNDSFLEIINIIKRYSLKLFPITLTQNLLSVSFFYTIIIILIYLLKVNNSISLGDLVATIAATNKLHAQVSDILSFFPKFREHSIYAEKFYSFNNYQQKIQDGKLTTQPTFKSIEFKNVVFNYPNSPQKTLDGVSFKICANQKIAIVGPNGSGKSTIIKLLLRLYEPTSGEILLNGEKIDNYKIESYRKTFNIVFQDFQLYSTTLSENVLGDIFLKENTQTVLSALKKADFMNKLSEMPKGIDSELTKEFFEEGINLSGGEAQKVALSRLFSRECSVLILDEPSSSLDPISEYNFNNTLMHNQGTTIIVSHRLSTIINADLIIVIDNGNIIECGTHTELITQNGLYSKMFQTQASNYQSDLN